MGFQEFAGDPKATENAPKAALFWTPFAPLVRSTTTVIRSMYDIRSTFSITNMYYTLGWSNTPGATSARILESFWDHFGVHFGVILVLEKSARNKKAENMKNVISLLFFHAFKGSKASDN